MPGPAWREVCEQNSRRLDQNGAVVLTNVFLCAIVLSSRLDAAWTDISGSVEERKQHLEESNKNLDIFKTAELQLGQWLSEKELMMSVLGPLSIDPNMLKMQKQQVQVRQMHTESSFKSQYFIFSSD